MMKAMTKFLMVLVFATVCAGCTTYCFFHKPEAPKKTVEYVWGGCR